MNFRNQKITTAAALFLVFAVAQVYIGVSFAEPNANTTTAAVVPQQLMGILTTRDNQPILVNGVSTVSGATIPAGASIETPDNVSATITIGGLGTVCIAPNTKLVINFDTAGKKGNVGANLTVGCVIVSTVKDVKGQIAAGSQIVPTTGGSIDVCLPEGQPLQINKGAAANAGAGAGGSCLPPAGAAAVPPSWDLGTRATAAIIGGTAVTLCIIFCNPSPSTP
jgi:hypothetical protein